MDQAIRWVAITGEIVPVAIVTRGMGDHTTSSAPPDPVIVRSIEDHFEFVASESCLFTDRNLALIEAKRLRREKEKEILRALARVEQRELLSGTRSPTALSIPLKEGSDTPVSVVEMVTTESSASDTPMSTEDDVPKKTISDDSEKPCTLLQRVIYVIGQDTISFDEVCQRLLKRHWFPKRRSSVSNVLSAHKNLFTCPTKGMYSLRSRPKAKANPIDEAVIDNLASDEPKGSESNELQEALAAVKDEEEDEGEGEEGSDEPEASVEASTEEEGPNPEFTSWMGKPMKELTPEHSHFRDDDVVFSEKCSDGTWTAEVFVTGLDLWSEGSSEDRAQAREVAENNLRCKVRNLRRIIKDLAI